MPLERNLDDKVIAGVCSGLAQQFEVDPIIVRLAFILAFMFWGVGPIIYIILWLLMQPKGVE